MSETRSRVASCHLAPTDGKEAKLVWDNYTLTGLRMTPVLFQGFRDMSMGIRRPPPSPDIALGARARCELSSTASGPLYEHGGFAIH